MKTITNEGLQSKTLLFNNHLAGPISQHWLKPGESVTVPLSWISDQIKTLEQRRILKITNKNR
jgi:hypothetical protein